MVLSRPPGLKACVLSIVLMATAAGLAGCEAPPPDDAGVCWHMVLTKDGKAHYNRLADKVPNLETCAMKLEVMRLQFLRAGGSRTEVQGAYQGQYLWLQREGVYVSQTREGNRYPALKRLPDGTLAVPSAVPVP
jgi:hypothetical protein